MKGFKCSDKKFNLMLEKKVGIHSYLNKEIMIFLKKNLNSSKGNYLESSSIFSWVFRV